jgi:HSP20 family protein
MTLERFIHDLAVNQSLPLPAKELTAAGLARPFGSGGLHAPEGGGVDLYETPDALVLELAVPGATTESLDVTITGRRVTISYARPQQPEGERRYWIRSLAGGSVKRSIALPFAVASDGVQANLTGGILILTLPKPAQQLPRKIDVTSG